MKKFNICQALMKMPVRTDFWVLLKQLFPIIMSQFLSTAITVNYNDASSLKVVPKSYYGGICSY